MECLQFTFHELLAHCGQMKAWATRIAAGDLPRYCGLTTVHTPEQVMLEGLAQTLPLMIPNDAAADPVLAVRLTLMRYRLMMDNNLHCMINNGATIERCAAYHERWSLGHSTRRAVNDSPRVAPIRSTAPTFMPIRPGASSSGPRTSSWRPSSRPSSSAPATEAHSSPKRSARSSMTGGSSAPEANGTSEADGDLFVYGTLLLPAVVEALIGRVPGRLPATLHDYCRYRLAGKVFPAIAFEPAAKVDGLIYRGLDHGERMTLDAFESSIYTRQRVHARTTLDEIVTVHAYVLDDDHAELLQRTPAWSLEQFTAHSGAAYIRMCTEFRTCSRSIDR